ncbi:MAG TPA: glutamate-1-semialdehyde 2,1-aminomutase, partial [Terriglobales bacterium]|nr:glutamate-1-semialdehyde 2,1-aminomutase [Terriglobales bacterium]
MAKKSEDRSDQNTYERAFAPRDRSAALSEHAHRVIPGGAHTYAKGDDQFPVQAPGFIARGRGCHVWDVDGNEFVEYGMGLRAVTLGHAFEPVVQAVAAELSKGTNFTRPSPLEVEYADRLLEMVPGADMVKFAKDGSDTLDAAVRLARAYTGRDLIAICADQPFFSTSDWFIGTTDMSAGIPANVRAQTVRFRYNDLASVRGLFDQYPRQVACVVLEAARTEEPAPGFLKGLQDLCRQEGAILIFDEMITGFRWHKGGAQGEYAVTPDLSTWGKALANGFCLSALLGRRELMELGGIAHSRERVFLLSTTHGAETHSIAAGLATYKCYQELGVLDVLYRRGAQLRAGIETITSELGLQSHFGVVSRDCNLLFYTRDSGGKPSQEFRTLFMQEMIRRRIIAPSLVVSFSHTEADIARTLEAIGESLHVYKRALGEGVE